MMEAGRAPPGGVAFPPSRARCAWGMSARLYSRRLRSSFASAEHVAGRRVGIVLTLPAAPCPRALPLLCEPQLVDIGQGLGGLGDKWPVCEHESLSFILPTMRMMSMNVPASFLC